MTPVSFVKTKDSYEVSLVTINRQTSYDSDILCQGYEIIRGFPMNHTRFADWITIAGTDRNRIGPDCAVIAIFFTHFPSSIECKEAQLRV